MIDVRIKRIDLPSEVSQSVYQRMSADESVATKRSDGKALAESVRAAADAEATVIVAKAQEEAALVKAKGQAEAARIGNEVYTKDRKFYYLYKSLYAYMESFHDSNDLIVLTQLRLFQTV